MEYRGYVHKERRTNGEWIASFEQIENDDRVIVELVARSTQKSAFNWASDRVRDAYDSISVAPSRQAKDGVQLPRHCLWCGKLIRYGPKVSMYCTGHRGKARKSRVRLPYKVGQCWTPEKAAYLHRGTAIIVARLLDLDCYQCTKDDSKVGCNAYHLTSQARGILSELSKNRN